MKFNPNIYPPKEEQIKYILVDYLKLSKNEIFNWISTFSRKSISNFTDIEFDQIFSVSEMDIYQHVLEHGWGADASVCIVEHLSKNEEGNFNYFFLPVENNQWPLAKFNNYERSIWNISYFDSEESRTKFVVHELLMSQKELWGKPNFSNATLFFKEHGLGQKGEYVAPKGEKETIDLANKPWWKRLFNRD